MADQNKFEKMLELLINEDKEGAEALFHELVVEKSRDIYESLLEDESDIEEDSDEEVDEATDEEVDESEDDLDEATDEEVDESDEEVEEGFDLDEFEVEADDDMGGDPADMLADLGMDDEEGDMDDEGEDDDMEDRVEDLEDALEDLKAEFEKMMAGDDEGDDDDMDMDDEGEEEPEEESFAFEDEEVEESDEDLEEGKMKDKMIGDSEKMSKAEFAKKYGKEAADDMYETAKSAGEQMREYVEKVSATMGDNGANTKSAVASANDMGGTASNIAQNGDGGNGGSADSAKEDNAGNVNVPGAKGATKMSGTKGHGAEKKGAGETAANKKPTIGG